MRNLNSNLVLVALLAAAVTLSCPILSAADWPQWRGPNRDGTTSETSWSHQWKGEPKRAWQASVGIGFSSIAVAGGRAYTQGHVAGSNVLWCLNADTGAGQWSFAHPESLMANQFEGGPTSTPLVAAGRVFFRQPKGTGALPRRPVG